MGMIMFSSIELCEVSTECFRRTATNRKPKKIISRRHECFAFIHICGLVYQKRNLLNRQNSESHSILNTQRWDEGREKRAQLTVYVGHAHLLWPMNYWWMNEEYITATSCQHSFPRSFNTHTQSTRCDDCRYSLAFGNDNDENRESICSALAIPVSCRSK